MYGLVHLLNERCGRIVNAPASYREVPCSISARRLAILTEVFRGFLRSLRGDAGVVP
jgi:hypothetical protein